MQRKKLLCALAALLLVGTNGVAWGADEPNITAGGVDSTGASTVIISNGKIIAGNAGAGAPGVDATYTVENGGKLVDNGIATTLNIQGGDSSSAANGGNASLLIKSGGEFIISGASNVSLLPSDITASSNTLTTGGNANFTIEFGGKAQFGTGSFLHINPNKVASRTVILENNGTFINSGTIYNFGQIISSGTGSVFSNASGGKIDIQDGELLVIDSSFENSGSITASGAKALLQVTGAAVTGTGGTITFEKGAQGIFGDAVASNILLNSGANAAFGGNITGDVTVNGATLRTGQNGGLGTGPIAISGTLTTTGASTFAFEPDATSNNIRNITANKVTLSQNTRISIDKDVKGLVAGAPVIHANTAFNVLGGELAAYVASLNAIGGSAIQNIQYQANTNNTGIEIKLYELIEAYDGASRANSANQMAALGVNNASALVDNSFGKALFNVAISPAGANGLIDNEQVIAASGYAGVGVAQNNPSFAEASTTWSILRAFGGMVGGYNFSSGVEANSAASAMTGQNQAAAVSSMMSITNNNINSVNNRIASNNVARAKVQNMVGSDTALAEAAGASSGNSDGTANSGYLASNGGQAPAAGSPSEDFAKRFWLDGLGIWKDASSKGASNGYNLNTWGVIMGYDHIFGPFTLGGSFGYSLGSFEEKNVLYNDSEINNYAFNLYGTYNHSSGFFTSLIAGYAYSQVDMKRKVLVNAYESANYHVNTWNLGGNIGYNWQARENLTVTPRVGLQYIDARSGNINGTYTSITSLKDYATVLPIDLTVKYWIPLETGDLELTGRGGYAYNFSNKGSAGSLTYNNIVNVDPIAIQGRTPDHSTWTVGGGVKYQLGRYDVGLDYDYYGQSSYDEHRIMGTVGISF